MGPECLGEQQLMLWGPVPLCQILEASPLHLPPSASFVAVELRG